MLNSNGVKEIQRYAFNGSSLEEVYAIWIIEVEEEIKAQSDNTGWNLLIFSLHKTCGVLFGLHCCYDITSNKQYKQFHYLG